MASYNDYKSKLEKKYKKDKEEEKKPSITSTGAGGVSGTVSTGEFSSKRNKLEEKYSSYRDKLEKKYGGEGLSADSVQNWLKKAQDLSKNYKPGDTSKYTTDYGAEYKNTVKSLLDESEDVYGYLRTHKDEIANYDDLLFSYNQLTDYLRAVRSQIDGVNDYYKQFYGENHYNSTNMSLGELYTRMLVGEDSDEGRIAYTTPDGQNVTWKSLYELKKAEAEYDQLSAKPDWEEKSAALGADSVTFGDGSLSDEDIIFEINQSLMPHELKYALEDGYTEEQFNDIQAKREYISKKYGLDVADFNYDAVKELGTTGNMFWYMDDMTDKEKAVLSYIYNTQGWDAANEWLTPKMEAIEQRKAGRIGTELEEEHPFWANVISVPASLASGIEYVVDSVDYWKTGEDQYNALATASSTIRGNTAADIESDFWKWVYNTGMSAADSLVANYLPGGTFLLAGSAAAHGYNDAVARGLSPDEAIFTGFRNGVNEYLFERVSLGQFNKLKDGVVSGGKAFAKNLAKTMFVNATEETATEIANIVSDRIFNADFSQVDTTYRQYLANGLSPEEAKEKVKEDINSQIFDAGASGALMGFGFGMVGNTFGAYNYNQQATAEGNRVVSNGGVDALKALANDVAGVSNSNLTKLAGKVTSDQSKRNIKNVGKLSFGVDSARMEQNRADIKKALIEKGVSALKAGKYADILVDMNSEFYRGGSGFTLGTDKQWKQITGDKNAYSILRNIVTDESSSVNIRNLKHQLGRSGIIVSDASTETDENKVNAKAEGSVATSVKSVLNGEISTSEDNKTRVASTGTEVSIKGIAEIKMETADGKTYGVPYLKVVDAEGNESVVSSRDVEYSSKSDAILYESFAQMGLDPSYFDTYIGDLNAEGIDKTDANSVGQFALEYGLGVNIGSIGSKADLSKINLSETSRTHAYESGERQAKAIVEAKQSAIDTAVEERKSSGKGKVRDKGKVHYDAKKINNNMRRAGLEIGKQLTNLGVDVYLFESHQDAKGNFVDDNGNLADNGYYIGKDGSIHIDLNAGNNGEGIMVYTMSHELAHWMKANNPQEFKVFADLIVKWYGKKGQSVSDLVSERMAEENLSWDDAFEEVIARSCESFLTDSNIAERMAELEETSPKAAQIIRNWIRRFMNWVRSLYKDVDPQSAEGQLFHKWQNEIDEVYDAFFNTLKGASESFQWIGARDFSAVSDAKNTDGKTLFQHRAMEADKEAYRNMLIKHGVMTSSEITALFNTVDKALDIIKSNLEALDYAWDADIDDRAFSPVKPNSDSLYQVSLDFSTLCRKRILQQVIQAQLQEALNKQLSREESIAIRDELMKIQEEGRQIEIACALCYVESARMKSPAQINRFMENREAVIREFLASKSGGNIKQKIKQAELDARNKLGVGNESLKKMPKSVADQIRAAKKQAKKSYEPTADEMKLIDVALGMSVSDFTSPQGLENLAKNYPVLFDAYTSYIRNATKSKGIENDVWWRAGDSATIGDTLIANMNRENGLRSQSWSDFQVIHLLDYIAATIELSTRNAKEQAYSKVPDYIELMGKTGVMLNMSLIPTSDFNGTLRYDSTEGIDYNRSLELRDKYHETAGTICIGMGNGQIKLLLADGTIDYVIPYHKSGMAAHIRKLMHIPEWTDYEPYQSESTLSRTDAENNAKKYGVKLLDESDPNYHKHTSFSEWFNLEEAKQIAKMENAYPSNTEAQKKYGVMYGGYMAMQNAANNYLKLCAERGIAPKFSHENADFTGEDNYWKLLIDRKMVDNVTGEIIEQKTIQPIFDEDEVLRILNDELERYPKIKEDQEYATRKVIEKFLSGKMNDRLDADTIAAIMQKPVDNVTVTNIVASGDDISDGVKHSKRKSSLETYTEAQYNAFGWASYNDVITAQERETLLSRFADFKHNRNKYPVTRWGEAVIHSTEAPGVIVYIRSSSTIKLPEITRIVRIEVTDADFVDVETIQEEVILNEREQILQPYETAELIYGEKIFRTHKKRDSISFQEYRSREKGRGSKTNVPVSEGKLDGGRSGEGGVKGNQADGEGVKKSSRKKAPTFYSYMGVVVDGVKQEKLGAASVINMLKGKGVKDEEIKWSGIETWLEGKKSVTKQELQEFIAGSQLQIEETVLSEERSKKIKKISKNSIGLYDGGELVETFTKEIDEEDGGEYWTPQSNSEEYYLDKEDILNQYSNPRFAEYKLNGGKNYREFVFKMPDSDYSNKAMRAHWGRDGKGAGAKGILAHARLQDLKVDGKKMLFVEEVQSDWHNEGGKKGYIDESKRLTLENTEMRHEGEWYNLYHNGKDMHQGVSETFLAQRFRNGITDEEIHEGLVNEYNSVAVDRNNGQELVPDAPFRSTYHEFVMKRIIRMAAEEGYDSIGWTTAQIQSDRWSDQYSEGYRIEYDQDIPKFLRKYGKKWGAEVGKTKIDASDAYNPYYTEVWSMPITDSMKDSVLYEGQAMYSRRGVSNRSLLATALDGATKNDIEKNRLNEYKGKIALIESEQQKLTELRERIKELSFAPGTRDTAAIKKLQEAATRVANRINTYDRQLLNLEATAPLKAVLQREKEQVRKREKQKAGEALSAYREKAAKTLREVMNRNTESRKKSVEGRKKTVVRNKIKRVVTDLRGLLNRGTKERNVKTDMQETVGSALKLANVIFNDVISNEDIVLMGTTMATEEEQKLLDQYVAFIEKRDSSPVEEAMRYINKIADLNKKLSDLFKRERARLNQAKVSEAVDELAKAYSKLKDSNKGYVNFAYNEEAHKRLMSLSESLAGTIVKDMSLPQLEEVYDAYKMILHMVRESNSLFRMGKTQDLAEAVTSVQEQILDYYKEREKDPRAGAKKLSDLLGKFAWNEMKPLTAFETLGSEVYTELFWDAIKAESEWARWMEESKAFLDEQRNKYGYKSWKMDTAHEFTLPDGKVFRLTLQDMMSIYAYSKRDQAQEHMTVGGFQFDKKNNYKDKDGKKRVRLGELYVTDWSTIGTIIGELTDEQKKYVDAVQRYLTDMGKRGNEVSEILYGIGIFNEAEYFPLMSAKDYRSSVEEALNNTQTQVSLKNTGMTKQTVPHASNPIILQGFDDVVYGHIDKMAKYCTHVLPIENLRRVFDSVSADDDGGYVSTKAVIEKVFGVNAKNYFEQYITDLNGGVFVDGAESPTMAMFSKFKGTSVGASLSVVVQQPMAIIRAMDVIDLKHFILGKVGKAETKHLYDEIKKYAPVAIIKEMGGFDVGSSRTAREHLGVRTDKGIKRVLDTVNDAAMWGAGKADELGWGIIWKAVKREVASEKKLSPGTAEFFEACGERFTEVIVRTQVYDSVNSRSGYMRSKHELVKFATSFMGEPTTIINNAYLSILNAFRANGKAEKAKASRKLGRTMGVLLSSTLLTTLAKSFVYAMRDDDDDDEALLERWAKHTGENLGVWGDLNPLTMLPFARDIVSLFEGWDVERPDMTLIANVITSAKRLLDDDRKEGEYGEKEGSFTTADEVLTFIGDAANLFGVPLKNVIRDVNGIVNAFGDITDDVKPTDIGGAFVSGLTGDEKSNTDALYDAIVNGDTAKVAAIKKGYKDDSAVSSAIRKGLRDNDPRIKEAAKARYEGNISEYMRIAKEIKAEGYFSQDDIVAAINAEINKLKPDKESEPSSPAVVTVADYYKAIVSGQTGTATSIKDELVAQKVAEGNTKAEAESSVESGFVAQVKTAYTDGTIGQSKAISLIDTYGGDDGEKKTKEWDFEVDTGYTWSQRDNAYRLGAISRNELISYIEDIEEKDRDEAENDVRVYEFRDEYPEYSAVSSDAIKKFYEPIKDKNYSIEDTGMDIGTYAEYALQAKDCKGVDNDGDGKADSGTKKAEIMRVINSLPITYQQKDALYFLNGWSTSTLYQAPWR